MRRRADHPTRPRRPPGGWRVIAAKEFTDSLLSVRFYILLALVALAALASARSAADGIRQAAQGATDSPALFLKLFTVSPDRIPSFVALVGFLGPLLGIAFGFDAISSERSQGTLPRLVAQPIHRDDVINGKFVAGISLIGLTMAALTATVSGFGLFRLGIVPQAGDVARLIIFSAVAVLYIGVWLAAAILASVVLQRAATAVLATIATWLVLTIFFSLLVGLATDALAPNRSDPTFNESLRRARTEQNLARVSPETLYSETAITLLDPEVRSVGIILPSQVDRAVPGTLPLPQSLLVIWPQATALIALIVLIFSAAYALFMRQEVRA